MRYNLSKQVLLQSTFSHTNTKLFIQFNFQNFFQIVSNLLDEENKEKWEDAQQVRLRLS